MRAMSPAAAKKTESGRPRRPKEETFGE
jgi:hypothetical protein